MITVKTIKKGGIIMKYILRRGLALLCMLTLLLGVLPVGASAAELGEFTVLSTTDMHGHCWGTNDAEPCSPLTGVA